MTYTFWENVADKIYRKTCARLQFNKDKIPYTSIGGVFDDKSDDISWWTNGFRAGALWLLYGAFGNGQLRAVAEQIENKLDAVFSDVFGMDHDSGFRYLPSAGADYILTASQKSKNRLFRAANDLLGRFNPAGFIRAWNDGGDGSKAGVAIIDTMMNLPLLYRASSMLRDPRFANAAVRHADTALKYFLREDGSSRHIVVFDAQSGEFIEERGGQGLAVGSSWTRGQAWAIYGFALSFLHTRNEKYLAASKKAADYFISQIPVCGFIPTDFKGGDKEDSSAAAIAASAFIELSTITGDEKYRSTCERLLKTLCEFRCDLSDKADHILEKCSVSAAEGQEIPLIYGDFFLIEGILKLIGKNTFIW